MPIPRRSTTGKCTNFQTAGDNVVGAMQADLELKPGETRELIVLLGVGMPQIARQADRGRIRHTRTLPAGTGEAQGALALAARTACTSRRPIPSSTHMVNVWNAYNALITYAWSRSASLIYNGERDGLGYRDTVQDFLGVIPLLKDKMRRPPRADAHRPGHQRRRHAA